MCGCAAIIGVVSITCWRLLPMKGDMMDASQSRCRVSAHLACCRPQLADTLGANITTHLLYFGYLHYLSTSTLFAYIYLAYLTILNPEFPFYQYSWHSESCIILSVVCWCVQIINLFISGAGAGRGGGERRLRAADSRQPGYIKPAIRFRGTVKFE